MEGNIADNPLQHATIISEPQFSIKVPLMADKATIVLLLYLA